MPYLNEKQHRDEAWNLFLKEAPKNKLVGVEEFGDLPEEEQQEWLEKSEWDFITQQELNEWFGEQMPKQVSEFLLGGAPQSMTAKEMKAHIRQMGVDFRAPLTLLAQAFGLMADIKKNGNMAPSLVAKIDAWERRYLLGKREQEHDEQKKK